MYLHLRSFPLHVDQEFVEINSAEIQSIIYLLHFYENLYTLAVVWRTARILNKAFIGCFDCLRNDSFLMHWNKVDDKCQILGVGPSIAEIKMLIMFVFISVNVLNIFVYYKQVLKLEFLLNDLENYWYYISYVCPLCSIIIFMLNICKLVDSSFLSLSSDF